MSKELIIFDFFGVISSEVSPFWLERFFSKEKAKEIKKDIVEKGDIGILTGKEVFDKLSELTGESSEMILKDWLDLAVIDDNVIHLIKELRKKYKVVLLSNASGEFLHKVLKKVNVDELFDCIIISSEVGIVKPSKEIFEMILNEMKIEASKSIFIDDNIKNVIGAKNVGIDGIVFHDVNQLKTDLSEYIVISDEFLNSCQ